MRSISSLIAELGQSIQFVAACAHFFAAGYFVMLFHKHAIWVALIITGAASIKEFWFDAKYETSPPQTFTDEIEDWTSWIVGAWLPIIWILK